MKKHLVLSFMSLFGISCWAEAHRMKSIIESGARGVALSDEQIKEIAVNAVHNLGKNDSYYEAYWMSVEYTLDDYIDNLSINEEEDN